MADPDRGVTATNDDAALCKLQAVTKGYYKDEFLRHFVNPSLSRSVPRKAPEINRGYYIRSAAVAYLVEQFAESHKSQSYQIISLGAGYDSLYWRLLKTNSIDENCKYVELDLSPVTQHKLLAINRSAELNSLLKNVTVCCENLHSDSYHLLSVDLRQINKESLLTKLTETCKLLPNKPTLVIAECVLIYMLVQDSDAVIKFLSTNFSQLSFLNYEQCNINDKFGQIMMDNMSARNCNLMGFDACETLESQIFRFTENNLIHTRAWTLFDIYNSLLLPSEVDRIERLEFLDEKELLDQLLQHYCIVVASNNALDTWLHEDKYWFSKCIT